MSLILSEVRETPLLWLLVFVPVVFAGEHLWPESHTLLFLLSVLAIIPLAALLSRATESVAERTGDAIGGLLNATLGNLTELVIATRPRTRGEVDGLPDTSQPRSLLSMARLNMARSGVRPSTNNRVLIAQTCFGRRGGFAPISLPLFHGARRELQSSLSGMVVFLGYRGGELVPLASQQYQVSFQSIAVLGRPPLRLHRSR
jgi:Sodium/calcium exchanger protein